MTHAQLRRAHKAWALESPSFFIPFPESPHSVNDSANVIHRDGIEGGDGKRCKLSRAQVECWTHSLDQRAR